MSRRTHRGARRTRAFFMSRRTHRETRRSRSFFTPRRSVTRGDAAAALRSHGAVLRLRLPTHEPRKQLRLSCASPSPSTPRGRPSRKPPNQSLRYMYCRLRTQVLGDTVETFGHFRRTPGRPDKLPRPYRQARPPRRAPGPPGRPDRPSRAPQPSGVQLWVFLNSWGSWGVLKRTFQIDLLATSDGLQAAQTRFPSPPGRPGRPDRLPGFQNAAR